MENSKLIWFDGELMPWENATVHVMTHALHYGTGVFEGIRVYENEDGPAGFRMTDHMARLRASAATYSMPLEYSVEELVAAAADTVRSNGLTSCNSRKSDRTCS